METHETPKRSLLKRLALAAASRSFRYLLQCGPRTQNLRVLDRSEGHCPPFAVLKQPAIFIVWHESIALPIGLGFHSPMALLVSQHRDANWLNSAAEEMGFAIVRGSTTRGGSGALRKLKELSATHSMVITPDGPKGPRRVMNIGAAYLAALLQLPIIPVGVGLSRPWRLNTWDRFAVPKIGHRARIVFGPPIRVPRRCERDMLENYSAAIGSDLDLVSNVAEQWACSDFEYPQTRRLNLWGRWVVSKSGRMQTVPELNTHVRQWQLDQNSLNTADSEPTDSLRTVA